MDYEAILESARREAGAEFVATFARGLAAGVGMVRNIRSDYQNVARVEDPICFAAGLTVLVVILALRMVRVPGTDGRSDDDSVFIRGHGVLYVRWNEQEAANGVRLEVRKVECFAEADLQYALNHRDPGVGGMRVEVMESRRNESRVCEGLACHVALAFEH
jgi:hypothetical protein